MLMTTAESHRANPFSAAAPRTLLLPVDATDRSRWSIQYALRKHAGGRDLVVHLLLVAEPVTNWEVLRFYSQERVRQFQVERGSFLLEDAAQPLRQAGITVQTHLREGDIAFNILDVAEQLDCDEIVLPVPHPRWTRLPGADIVRAVLQRQRDVLVTVVTEDGTATIA